MVSTFGVGDDKELVLSLLDKGMRVAFFQEPESESDDDHASSELQQLQSVLGFFPRGRMGMSYTYRADDSTQASLAAAGATIKEKMKMALSTWGELASSYMFEVIGTNNTDEEAEAVGFHGEDKMKTVSALMLELASHAKALTQQREGSSSSSTSSTMSVYLAHRFVGLPEASADLASRVSTVMRGAVHAAVCAKLVTTDGTEEYSGYCLKQEVPTGLFGGVGWLGLGFKPDTSPLVDIVGAYVKTIMTDRPDGLFTTAVCNERGVCLGLEYSSEESIRAAVFEKKGIYWSRSGKALWRKGETSGTVQGLLAVDLDCDGDSLRFTVSAAAGGGGGGGGKASFCHRNTRTCWGDDTGISRLESVLQSRLRSAPPHDGSSSSAHTTHTDRFFSDLPDGALLQRKLLEGVHYLVEAEEQEEIAKEAAEVVYFVLTRCVAAGVSLSDIEGELDCRGLRVSAPSSRLGENCSVREQR
jgi:phosphoribosyl-AMP cyclohydrolase/phosphoribosyl-ATP pyrophosphohydrolase